MDRIYNTKYAYEGNSTSVNHKHTMFGCVPDPNCTSKMRLTAETSGIFVVEAIGRHLTVPVAVKVHGINKRFLSEVASMLLSGVGPVTCLTRLRDQYLAQDDIY